MAVLLFEVDKLFMFHVPLLVKFHHGLQLLVLLPFGFRLRRWIVGWGREKEKEEKQSLQRARAVGWAAKHCTVSPELLLQNEIC
jgi:hypothetical protein